MGQIDDAGVIDAVLVCVDSIYATILHGIMQVNLFNPSIEQTQFPFEVQWKNKNHPDTHSFGIHAFWFRCVSVWRGVGCVAIQI